MHSLKHMRVVPGHRSNVAWPLQPPACCGLSVPVFSAETAFRGSGCTLSAIEFHLSGNVLLLEGSFFVR